MSRRLLTLLVVTILVAAVAPVIPVKAQDELPACTDEERTKLNDILTQLNDEYSTAGQAMSSMDTVPNVVNAIETLETLRQSFHTTIEEEIPPCADSFVVVVTLEFMLDNTLLTLLDSGIILGAATSGDLTAITAYTDIVTFHSDMLVNYADQYPTMVETLATGPLMDEWFPACAEADLSAEEVASLDDLVTAYNENLDAIQAFVTDGTYDDAAFLAVEQDVLSAWEPLSESAPQCGEVVIRLADEGYLYYNTAIAFSMAKLADIATAQGEAEAAQKLIDMKDVVVEDLQVELEDWTASAEAAG
jgi:hypothetical protein